jgi:hypothetical protein
MKFDKIEIGAEIPKVIYLTHSETELPLPLLDNIKLMKETNPDWKCVLFNDAQRCEYIRSRSAYLFDCYQKIDAQYGPARADFFRYIVMYYEGGCYLDIKSNTSTPLSQVLKPQDKYILSYWDEIDFPSWGRLHKELRNPIGEFQQWNIIAVKGHPFLAAVIEAVADNIMKYNPYFDGVGKKGVIKLTGPVVYSNTIYPLINKFPCTIYPSEKALGLVYSVFKHSHHLQFKKHYTTLLCPVVSQGAINTCCVVLYYKIGNALRWLSDGIMGLKPFIKAVTPTVILNWYHAARQATR